MLANVTYTPDWRLFAPGAGLAQQALDFLAALGLVATAGFFVWGAIIAAAGQASQVPHNVARGKIQMLVSALCALGIGIGHQVINAFYDVGTAASAAAGG